MKHDVITSLDPIHSDCLVIGLFAETQIKHLPLPASIRPLMTHLKTKLHDAGDILYHSQEQSPDYILIHCGTEALYDTSALKDYVYKISSMITQRRLASVTIALPQLACESADWQVEQMVIQFEAEAYQFLELKTRSKGVHATKTIHWYLPDAQKKCAHSGQIIAESIRFTRHLANLPANICTPTYMAKQAKLLGSEFKSITTKVLDKAAMEKLGMGLLLSVARGSIEPPKLIQIHYKGAAKKPPIVLIGKGITFDSGGISLKPPEFMEEMKYDMAGAASVMGTLRACASLKLPVNVIGLMACTENMPSGSATKPGDVVTSMSGQTVEITNTDAEGRLILADTLTYAKQFKPEYVIDIATLTGAIIISLGSITTGLFSNDEELSKKILAAGRESLEKTWQLPLDRAYQDMLESPIADMLNSPPGKVAGSIVAASFLARYADSFKWAHLDIAGTGWVSGKNRCATGRPVSLLVHFLRDHCHAAR